MVIYNKDCSACNRVLPLLDFHKDKSHSDGYKSRCKLCRKSENPERARRYSLKYYEKNAEDIKRKKVEAYKSSLDLRQYRLAHNRKRRAHNFLANKIILKHEILEAYGDVCYLCNCKIDLTISGKPGLPGWQLGLHIDHVIPVSQGGPTVLENLRPTHGVCNLRRKKK
jgi:5-methylcytosine-specific restriction endonuclease McrA